MSDNQFLVRVRGYESPMFRPCTPEIRERKIDALLTFSQHLYPVNNNGLSDIEDFYEDAYRFNAAVKSFGPENIWAVVGKKDWENNIATNVGTKETRKISLLTDLPRWGSTPSQYADVIDSRDDALANAYARYPSFTQYGKRRIQLCGFGVEAPHVGLIETLLSFKNDGINQVVIKGVKAKSGIWKLDISNIHDEDSVYNLLFSETDESWVFVTEEGRPNAFLVQEAVTMRYEYRLFVVDGVPVTGAGAIEEFTPLDNSSQFDTQVRERRGYFGVYETGVVDRPDVVEKLKIFGVEVAAVMKSEDPELFSYTLDVALNENDEPMVVERNSIWNSGLYASDPSFVTDALKQYHYPSE